MIELISDHPDLVICRPVGELDAYSAQNFSRVLSDVMSSGVALDIDLILVTFIDLTGARAIRKASRYVSRQGIPTRVLGASEAVRRMMDLLDEGSRGRAIPLASARPHMDGPFVC